MQAAYTVPVFIWVLGIWVGTKIKVWLLVNVLEFAYNGIRVKRHTAFATGESRMMQHLQ